VRTRRPSLPPTHTAQAAHHQKPREQADRAIDEADHEAASTTMLAADMSSLLSGRPQNHLVARRARDGNEGSLGLVPAVDRVSP